VAVVELAAGLILSMAAVAYVLVAEEAEEVQLTE
tara:strand:- start:545 stop:646 length:102 start_codon:yes stop_codon:yes gene_type:complete